MIRGIDWGAYLSATQGPAIPFKDLHDAGLLDFFVVKGNEEAEYYSSVRNIQWARDAGCQAVGSYYWHFPYLSADYQVQLYSAAIRAEKPDFIALDMEDAYGCSDWQITTNAEAVCAGLTSNFPELPFFVYTSADYINGFCPTFNRSIGKYRRWIACWPGGVKTGMDRYLSFDEIKQYPLPGWEAKLPNGWTGWDIWQNNNWAIPEGYGWPYDHQYDWDVCNLTIEQLTGKQESSTMAGIFNQAVPLAQRAWVMEYKGDQKVTAGIGSLGVDAIILPMVNTTWDGSHRRILADTNFAGRFPECKAAGRVLAKVTLDAAVITDEMHSETELLGHNVWQNLVVPRILDAWHVGPWTQSTLKPADFRAVDALIFEMESEVDHLGKAITDPNQALWFTYVLDKWRVLVNAGAVPNVPIIFKTTSAWLQKYPSILTKLGDGRKSWLYLALYDQKLTSTGVFADLWGVYQWVNWDTYKYPFVPDGYGDRVLLFEFTRDTQKLAGMTGEPTINLSLWCDTADNMKIFLPGVTVPQDPTIAELQAKIAELQTQLAAANATIASQSAALVAWDEWLNKAPKQGPG